MEVKKSSLIFFLYALVMFWPDYFFFGMIKYLENLLLHMRLYMYIIIGKEYLVYQL